MWNARFKQTLFYLYQFVIPYIYIIIVTAILLVRQEFAQQKVAPPPPPTTTHNVGPQSSDQKCGHERGDATGRRRLCHAGAGKVQH